MNTIRFTLKAWQEYLDWQQEDKKTLHRINQLLTDIQPHPFTGIGKPEPLKHRLPGFWSRRIDKVNRLVYRIRSNDCEIAQCKGALQ